MTPDKIHRTITIPDHLAGMRLDQALAALLPEFSRTQLHEWIKNQQVTLNGKVPKPRITVIGHELVVIDAYTKLQPIFEAQPIQLNVVYEDDDLIVINKPINMVVHPAAGNPNNTLLNALLHHHPALQKLPRAGIIHRLDKNTSGLLVIAKTSLALNQLSAQLKARSITRLYQAVVSGVLVSGGTVNAPIGRHPIQRKQMAVSDTGKEAITHYRIMERYRAHTRLKVQLETGRTHQIRVHMAHIRYPIVGDITYSGRLQLPKGASPDLIQELRQFKRQALHACELGLIHPTSGQSMSWRAALPDDMQQLIACLQADMNTPDKNNFFNSIDDDD